VSGQNSGSSIPAIGSAKRTGPGSKCWLTAGPTTSTVAPPR
jgi:hypothetical protein